MAAARRNVHILFISSCPVFMQGPYTVRLIASGKGGAKKQLFCLDVDFDVVVGGLQQTEAAAERIMEQ